MEKAISMVRKLIGRLHASGLPIIYHVYANAMFLAIKEASKCD